MNLKLIRPTLELEEKVLEYVKEWNAHNESMSPGILDLENSDYKIWLENVCNIQSKRTCPPGLVPADLFFLSNKEDELLGAIQIRHDLNEYLLNYGGHIGYGVRPSKRQQGYAKRMLKLGLLRCKDLGLKKVLVTCNEENFKSEKTIIANGGVYENMQHDGQYNKKRYWIYL